MKWFFRVLILTFFVLSSFSYASKDLKAEEVVSIGGVPWGMAFLDEKQLLINQKDGKIYLYNLSTQKLTLLANPPKSKLQGQGGLLDVQISPNYKTDKWIYFTYVKEVDSSAVTVLARAKLKDKSFYSWEELLVSESSSNTGAHFGSRITFDEEGHLYFSIGDRGVREKAQDLQNHAGTIIRLNLDGSIPKDNPFVKNQNALDEIFSYGHRNPQGLFYDKQSKKIYSIEHGPRGGDEINIIEAGKNYGWPVISYGKEYWAPFAVGEGTHKEGMQQPIKVYIPSIAPSSLIVYSGKIFKEYKGNIFSGALKLRHINRIVLDENQEVVSEQRLFENLNERIRNIIESPKGYIYFSTDNGRIYVIK